MGSTPEFPSSNGGDHDKEYVSKSNRVTEKAAGEPGFENVIEYSAEVEYISSPLL